MNCRMDKGRCTALTEKICKHGACPFFKTQEQWLAERKNVRKRLKEIGYVSSEIK